MPPSSRKITSVEEIQAVQARIQKLKLLAVARKQAKTVAANLDKIGDKVHQQQQQHQLGLSSSHHNDRFEGDHDKWNALANRVSSSNKRSTNTARNKKELFRSWTFDESALPSNTTRRSADSTLLRRHARAARRSDPGPVTDQSYIGDKAPVATDSTTLLRSWKYAPDNQRETVTPPTSSSEDRYASDTAAARKEFDNERRRMIESDVYEEETLKFQSARKATDYADKEVSEKIANTLGDDNSESEQGRPIANLIQRVKNLRWATSL
mmetsp:Transcript_25833/g.40069  ORF Transcript_25833/g.40069 Transcript_25833/m.40069 type:complete len:267 (+) Transcript_25833:437-1237(+)|eukprot:CAMPEP_0196822416 /NCGR_PEP_ID=MMETSP1362-20130617/83403_1 /TAXON_ID=163516 /ORGANISM="Leptocylindrus danicus, Strain CCMP1856" /LENGTH=266 /DNA_ID=CAMNT_0042201965 /DNA_START=434 /DNA_END=1234 /DNA_ORIENTATION=+